jgi:acyl carrier protein
VQARQRKTISDGRIHPTLSSGEGDESRRQLMSDTFNEVKGIIVELLGIDESKVTMEAKFREDLEADSLDLVELIMAFEEKFGGEISDEDAQKITSVGEVVQYIEAQMK